MSDERAGIEPGKLLLPHREGHHRNVGSLDALITKLLIERHVRITVDRRYDRRLLACRSELLDLADDGLPVGMPERRVVDHDVGIRDALLLEIGFEDLVGRAWINIIRAGEHPPLCLAAILGHQIINCWNGLLIWRGAR